MKKKVINKIIACVLVTVFMLVSFPISSALAGSMGFTAVDESITFDTGTGELGDIHFKEDGVYVRGDIYPYGFPILNNDYIPLNTGFYSRNASVVDGEGNLYFINNTYNVCIRHTDGTIEQLDTWDLGNTSGYRQNQLLYVDGNIWVISDGKTTDRIRYINNGVYYNPNIGSLNGTTSIASVTTDGTYIYFGSGSNRYFKVNKDGTSVEELPNPPIDSVGYYSFSLSVDNNKLYALSRYNYVWVYDFTSNSWTDLGRISLGTHNENYAKILVTKNGLVIVQTVRGGIYAYISGGWVYINKPNQYAQLIQAEDKEVYIYDSTNCTLHKLLSCDNAGVAIYEDMGDILSYEDALNSTNALYRIHEYNGIMYLVTKIGVGHIYNRSELKRIKEGSSINIDAITPFEYNPGQQNYDSDNHMLVISNVPNWHNVTVDSGVTVTNSKGNALVMKVAGTLTNNGTIETPNGLGGVSPDSINGGYGEDTNGILIACNNFVNNGQIKTGNAGGGGAGRVSYSCNQSGYSGIGGTAGNIVLYSNNIANNGEIRTGQGGGSGSGREVGKAYNATQFTSGGNGGSLKIYSNTLINNNILASGLKGGAGRLSYDSDDGVYYRAWGGYGGGSGGVTLNSTCVNGGDGNSPGVNPRPDIPTYVIDGGIGEEGYYTKDIWHNQINSYEVNTSPIIIKADSYTDGGFIKQGWETEKRDPQYCVTANTVTTYNNYWADTFKVNNLIVEDGSVSFKEVIAEENIVISENAELLGQWDGYGNLASYTSAPVTPVIYAKGDIIIYGYTDSFKCHHRDGYNYKDNRNFDIKAEGNIYLYQENANDHTFWNGRSLFKLNNLRILPSQYTANISANGLITVDLTSYTDLYNNPAGTMPNMTFRVFRQVEDIDDDFVFLKEETKQLGSSVESIDWDTYLLKDTIYRVGFKNNNSPELGFIHIMCYNSTGRSEGAGVDDVPPVISYFVIQGEPEEVQNNYCTIILKVTDGRTPRAELVSNIIVDGVIYNWFNGGFIEADSESDTSTFPEVMNNLFLGEDEGVKYIIANVMDKSGNVATRTIKVTYAKHNEPTESIIEDGITDIEGNNLTLITYNGQPAYVSKSDSIVINYSEGYANSRIRASFEGSPWGSYKAFSSNYTLPLSKSEGLVIVNYQIMKANGNIDSYSLRILVDNREPMINGLSVFKNATVTQSSNVTLNLSASDNINEPLKFSYSINNGTWSESQEISGNTINVSGLEAGINTINVKVIDCAGNIVEKSVNIFKI